jgi:alkanesulfonate monooxygenase SsuD/methylene tetrahydromethanopterin reductase-like flavin-dependent oxidoreductase (luciferase family)
MEIYTFDETTYPGIPKEIGAETIQTNRFCDPELAARTVREHMDEFVLGEELGYDGTFINEHHFTYFSLNPSSTPLAAALIARTSKMKVGVIGHVLPLRHPVHTAEEFAQLDVLSGGRFIGGIVRGVPQEYVSYNIDPFSSRERFAESYDILQKCLTEEIFDYEGKFYNLKAVSIWPLPIQKPLPVWMPAGSADTIEFAAERRIPIARVWEPPESFQDVFDYYRTVARERFGWEPGPESLIGARYVHVAETTEQAIEECREAVMYVRRLATFSRPVQIPAPVPGMNTDRSFDFRRQPKGMPGPGVPFEQLRDEGFIVCGDPDYVADWLRRDFALSGYGRFLAMFHVGSLKHEQVLRSKRLFAEHVMPRLRGMNLPSALKSEEAVPPRETALRTGTGSPAMLQTNGAAAGSLPLYAEANYQLTRESPETIGDFVERSNGRVIAGWEMRVPDRGPDGVPYRMILVGPSSEHRGSAFRLHITCTGGGEPEDDAEVTVDTYHVSGAERSLAFSGTYGQFKRISDQHADEAAVSIQTRADLGEHYIVRLSVSVPADAPQPDPAGFESYFELDCTKLWWYESA